MKIKAGALLAVLFILVTSVRAQQTSLITNLEGRHRTNLDGHWQIIIDPYETGYYDSRYQPSTNGYFKNAEPQSPSDLVEYDFDTSQQLNVPGDWNSQDEKLLFYEGTIWYKKSFDYQKREGTRLSSVWTCGSRFRRFLTDASPVATPKPRENSPSPA
jgi:beta-glucuronidase